MYTKISFIGTFNGIQYNGTTRSSSVAPGLAPENGLGILLQLTHWNFKH